jgi:hypothetical protein
MRWLLLKPKNWEVYNFAGAGVKSFYFYNSAIRHADDLNWKHYITNGDGEEYEIFRVRRRQNV